MELKLIKRIKGSKNAPYSSNRTFMELKSLKCSFCKILATVLIVPLWN